MNYRNAKILRAAKDSPCQLCGADDGTIVAAHSNQQKDGRGAFYKSHDYRVAYLCYKCHHEIDHGSKMTREERRQAWDEGHRATIGWLFANGRITVI